MANMILVTNGFQVYVNNGDTNVIQCSPMWKKNRHEFPPKEGACTRDLERKQDAKPLDKPTSDSLRMECNGRVLNATRQ